MGKSQCPHCGHIVTGFEGQVFEGRMDLHRAAEAVLAALDGRVHSNPALQALANLREALNHACV